MNHSDYRVGWVCALQGSELPVAEAMRDEAHDPLPRDPLDPNIYSLGRMGEHNVVIACCPAGRYGSESATTVATSMRRTFPNIEMILVVGTGGGLPNMKDDIRLGDVVVSQGNGNHGGCLRYDMGKRTDDHFLPKRYLSPPPPILASASGTLQSLHKRKGPGDMMNHLTRMLDDNPLMAEEFGRPSDKHDIMSFDMVLRSAAPTVAVPQETTPKMLQLWPRMFRNRVYSAAKVHYGLIATGNHVIASYKEAERIEKLIAGDDKILCFEMEAAGLMNDLPCLVIRGISSYADALKNDRWQPYAAATAAAYAKELLSVIPVQAVAGHDSAGSWESRREEQAQASASMRYGSPPRRTITNTTSDIDYVVPININANSAQF